MSIGNSFTDLVKKYQAPSSAGEVQEVTTSTTQNLDNLTYQAINEVAADNPDYNLEGDDSASWSEILSTTLSGIKGVTDSANQCIQSLSQAAKSSDAAATEKEYVSQAADDYNKTLADFNKNPEKNKETLLQNIGNARTTIGTLGTEIGTLRQENNALEKVVNGNDVNAVLGTIKEGAETAVNERNAAEQRVDDITSAITNIASAMTENEENIVIVNDKTVKVSNLSDEAKELAGVKDAQVVEIKADETETSENIQTLLNNFKEKNNQCNEKQAKVTQLESSVNTAESNYNSAKTAYESTPATITETVGEGENAKPVTRDNPAKAKAKSKMDSAHDVLEQAKKDLQKAKEDKETLEGELKQIGSNIKVGETTLDKIIEARGQAESERDAAQDKVDAYATQLKGYINEGESLKSLAAKLDEQDKAAFNAQTENNNLINALIESDDKYSNLTVDIEEAKATASKKLEENNAAIKTKEADKKALESFVKNAEAAITKQNEKDASTKTDKDTQGTDDKGNKPSSHIPTNEEQEASEKLLSRPGGPLWDPTFEEEIEYYRRHSI